MRVGLELMQEMERCNVEVDVYTLTSFINTAKQDGSPHAIATAYGIFKRSLQETRRSPRLYATMISALGRGSFVAEAEQLLAEAEAAGIEPDVAMYGAAMQAVADGARRDADVERVLRIHAQMLARGIKDNEVTRRILARCQQRSQQ
jgi:pentatricopeptide repeat protein